MKPRKEWVVTPLRGPVFAIDERGLWGAQSDVPGLKGFPRTMHIVRRQDGSLLFHNAVPLDDANLATVQSFGRPAQLVVPHANHCLDVAPFAERLGLQAFTPTEALPRVRELIPNVKDLAELPADNVVRTVPLEGTSIGEHALLVSPGGGGPTHVLVADVVMNVPHRFSINGLIFRLMRFTGPEPRMVHIFRRNYVRDPAALAAALTRLAETPGLGKLAVSHGETYDDAASALSRVAASLG